MQSSEARKAQLDATKEEGFDHFISNEANKILMSQIPAGETPEVLKAILREAYDAGYANGAVSVITDMLKSMRPPRV